MKVHNCTDCPLAYVQDGETYLRRKCTDEMCDDMIGTPDPGTTEFYLYFHRDVETEQPEQCLVDLWKKRTQKAEL